MVAAGGIADGRGVVAALALGAVGVWLGTRFIATPEAHGHVNYKNRIVALDEEGTVVTRAASGKPCRLIVDGPDQRARAIVGFDPGHFIEHARGAQNRCQRVAKIVRHRSNQGILQRAGLRLDASTLDGFCNIEAAERDRRLLESGVHASIDGTVNAA